MALVWEQLERDTKEVNVPFVGKFNPAEIVKRAKVPGGWLVLIMTHNGSGVTFYPDPNHLWDGNSLP